MIIMKKIKLIIKYLIKLIYIRILMIMILLIVQKEKSINPLIFQIRMKLLVQMEKIIVLYKLKFIIQITYIMMSLK